MTKLVYYVTENFESGSKEDRELGELLRQYCRDDLIFLAEKQWRWLTLYVDRRKKVWMDIENNPVHQGLLRKSDPQRSSIKSVDIKGVMTEMSRSERWFATYLTLPIQRW